LTPIAFPIEEREKGAEGYLGQIAEELEKKVYRPIPLWNSWTLQDTNYCSMDSNCESRWKKMIGKPYSGAKLE